MPQHDNFRNPMQNYIFHTLTYADLPLIRKWLMMPHVRAWLPDTEMELELMKHDMEDDLIDMRKVCLRERPFAYIHDHDAETFGMPQYADLPRGSRVITTFVGEAEFMGPGHSVGYLKDRLAELRRSCPLVAVGPRSHDQRLIATFTQAGFQRRRLATSRTGKHIQVMTYK